jgi:hypothetical protein
MSSFEVRDSVVRRYGRGWLSAFDRAIRWPGALRADATQAAG